MENQLQIISQLIKKISGQDHLPAASVFHQDSDNPPPHCAICLNDICEGERYRKLPKCVHSFHAHCIDAWFQSHSTCPLCRTQIPEIISLNENQERWNVLLNNIILLLKDLVERMYNPLNDELSSMISGNVRCIS